MDSDFLYQALDRIKQRHGYSIPLYFLTSYSHITQQAIPLVFYLKGEFQIEKISQTEHCAV